MTITVDQALAIARGYLAEHRPRWRVAGLLEDDEDFMIRETNDDPPEAIEIGPAFVFVSKRDGRVWTSAPAGDAVRKFAAMTEVAS